MDRHILWGPWEGPGLEHLHLTASAGGDMLADGAILGLSGGAPFRARYTVQCDPQWRVRAVRIDMLDALNRRLDLYADGAGHWTDDAGAELPGLAGCFDIDISATPFTNTLPIRRLALDLGAAADITVVYIDLPALTAQPAMQRYTRLAEDRYRFEARGNRFTADLPIDADSLVLDYPGLFRRIVGE
jgi:hypothetical protein